MPTGCLHRLSHAFFISWHCYTPPPLFVLRPRILTYAVTWRNCTEGPKVVQVHTVPTTRAHLIGGEGIERKKPREGLRSHLPGERFPVASRPVGWRVEAIRSWARCYVAQRATAL